MVVLWSSTEGQHITDSRAIRDLRPTAAQQRDKRKHQVVILGPVYFWLAGESEILRVRKAVLKGSAGYSHGLAPHASIPVYLQAELLLLC